MTGKRSPLGRLLGSTVIAAALFSCAPRTSMTLLLKMLPAQEKYFQTAIVSPFEKQQHIQCTVEQYANTDSIEYEIDKRKGKVGLVKVPFDRAAALARSSRLMPINELLGAEDLKKFTDTYVLTSLGRFDDKFYYIPRKFETRIMVYSKSKVAEAVSSWKEYRLTADSALAQVNGYGLPKGFLLETDPNQWDFYDIFMAGWVWSHRDYNGTIEGRIAHRGRKYSGTSLGFVDEIFQCGGDSGAVMSMKGDPVIDMFTWESIYAWSGVFQPRMWRNSWGGAEIWQGFKDGTVFLSFMTQLDCFFIHGTGSDGLTGFFTDPDDMGVAVMPKGMSAEIAETGKPIREGSRAITTGGWWWGIPRSSPDPQASFLLAQHITSTQNQVQESNRFGMIPVRKDILSDMGMMFGGDWIKSIYETSFKQMMHNGYTVIPGHARYNDVATVYLDAWYDIVVNGNWSSEKGSPPNRGYIAQLLDRTYFYKARELTK